MSRRGGGRAAGKPASTELVEPPRAGLPTTGRGYVTLRQGRRCRSRNNAAEIVCRRPWPGRAGRRRRRGVETVTITRSVRRCRCRRAGGPRACVPSIIYHHHRHRHTRNTYFVGCGPIASAAHPPLTDALDIPRSYYRFHPLPPTRSIWKSTTLYVDAEPPQREKKGRVRRGRSTLSRYVGKFDNIPRRNRQNVGNISNDKIE